MTASPRREQGLTLMEVLIAVTLLSLLSLGILMAMRVGLSAMERAKARLMDNRRVAGTQRILAEQIAGFVPAVALCGPAPDAPKVRMPFFQGEPQSMRFVSTYSLQEAWRGMPQILEFQVIPREDGKGVRLVVNEHLYSGPVGAGFFCLGRGLDPTLGFEVPRFPPIQVGSQSFVLADRLAWCRFAFLEPAAPPVFQRWKPNWVLPRWPLAVRIDMAPLEDTPAQLRPVTITAQVHVNRSLEIPYADQ
jgi:prepilin-type N-terminal cleavage/methylation domain-containing protein